LLIWIDNITQEITEMRITGTFRSRNLFLLVLAMLSLLLAGSTHRPAEVVESPVKCSVRNILAELPAAQRDAYSDIAIKSSIEFLKICSEK
jgi:hypothetical protein